MNQTIPTIPTIMSMLHQQQWIFQIFFIVFSTMLMHAGSAFFYRRAYNKLTMTKNIWDESLLQALHKPIGFLIWVLGLTFAAQIAAQKTSDHNILAFLSTARKTGILLLIVWFILRFIKQVETNLLTPRAGKKQLDKTIVHAISQLLTISVIITGVLVGIQMFGYSISVVLAFGGVGGIAVGFAAKDILANFFGGLMVYVDRPFKVDDWIRSPDRNIEGTVEHIGWRSTRIRTFDKRVLHVPNNVFSTISVENPSRMTNRRIKTNVGIRYDDADKMAAILSDIKSMLHNHPEIDTRQTLLVNFNEFADSSLNIMIYTFTKTVKWQAYLDVQEDVFIKVIEIISKHGAECAFPTQTLHMVN